MKHPGRFAGPLRASIATLILISISSAQAVTPTQAERALASSWAERMFGARPGSQPGRGLSVAFEDTQDSVVTGRSWRGTPFQIASKTYTHGLAFNSTKHLRVRLGAPGDRFVSDVGLENNDDTQRGAAQGSGSVTFHVLIAGKEVFSTPVRKLADPAVHVDLPLNGAEEFEIRVKDGGDGRGWDQALWGDATVTLKNGETLRLQDLPWADEPAPNPFVVSFHYQGKASGELLPSWERRAVEPSEQTRHVIYRDPATGLEVQIDATLFPDSPAVEWVASLRNTGPKDTPLLEAVQAVDGRMPLPPGSEPTLHWAKGAVASFDDFEPQETKLRGGKPFRLQPGGGRGSSQVMPFFNLAGSQGGVIAAVGWSGEWAAEFVAGQRGSVTWKAGLARTRLVLHPGESIRTPRMAYLFYHGDRWRGQNLFRQFVLKHHRPMLSGKPLVPPITCGNWGGTRAEIHLDNIQRIIQENLPIDYYWIDAEWYGKPGPAGSWASNVGDWQYKRDAYPAGFKPLSDALRASHRELMLWFEPERVVRGTPWHREHPDWLFSLGHDSDLLNLGNADALKFVTEFVSDRIKEFGLGCYRQDFNIDPLPFWQKADAPDRQGISEIRHIEGLYAYWDGLLARHPGLIIDNCASGGRRIELETLGRATPFWRTDGPRDPIAHQCHTYGLMAWVPLSATSQDRAEDDYEFRSSMCSSLCLNWWVSGDAPAERIPGNFPFAWARKTLQQYVGYRDLFCGDYYPLTAYSQSRDVWMAYQLDRGDRGRGLVVALRRPDSPYDRARLNLRELDGGATYKVTDLDTGTSSVVRGTVLMEAGLEVALSRKPGSALITYERE